MISKDEWMKLKEKEMLLKQACEIVRVEDKQLIKTVERFQKDLEKK